MRPFATIVVQDVPGFDEESRLSRPGVYRFNLHVGKEEFRRLLGCAPAGLVRADFDFAALDRILPSPVYAAQGFICILTPSYETLPELDRLVTHSLSRRRSSADRT